MLLTWGGSTLGYRSQRSKKYQEVLLIWTDPLCLLLPHSEQGASEELHCPSPDSPCTDFPSTLITAGGHIPPPAQCPSMEVSTVSVPPASATEGGDLCEISVINIVIHNVALFICLCGLVGNVPVFWIFSVRSCTELLADLTTTDSLFLFFAVPYTLLCLVNDVFCSALVPLRYLNLLFQLSLFVYHTELLWLMITNIKRYWPISFIFWRHVYQYLSELCMVIRPLHWAFFYAVIDVILIAYFPRLSQVKCQLVRMSLDILNHLLFAAPWVISTAILYVMVVFYPPQEKPSSLERIIFFSALYSFPISLSNFMGHLGYTVVSSQVVFLFTCIQTSIKPFIYFWVWWVEYIIV
ncbi:uncharacterized protein LOC107206121 [Parus major]|uniref:uncharacterized protein LOC107206121 n=1 Tax=Parus major TaxID=9157 RepID=UPI00077164E5|nr:uncharacterized protein LOC107206121 [Parus major]